MILSAVNQRSQKGLLKFFRHLVCQRYMYNKLAIDIYCCKLYTCSVCVCLCTCSVCVCLFTEIYIYIYASVSFSVHIVWEQSVCIWLSVSRMCSRICFYDRIYNTVLTLSKLTSRTDLLEDKTSFLLECCWWYLEYWPFFQNLGFSCGFLQAWWSYWSTVENGEKIHCATDAIGRPWMLSRICKHSARMPFLSQCLVKGVSIGVYGLGYSQSFQVWVLWEMQEVEERNLSFPERLLFSLTYTWTTKQIMCLCLAIFIFSEKKCLKLCYT